MVTLKPKDQQQQQHHRRELFAMNGWNLGAVDDDCPRPPEPCPLSSGQSRRAWAQLGR
jgi:hypothetical protein